MEIELAIGKQIFNEGNTDSGMQACAVCHQPSGLGNTRFSRVAAQHDVYTLGQLADFKSGRRATDRQMVEVAQKLSLEEMQAVAQYMASLGNARK